MMPQHRNAARADLQDNLLLSVCICTRNRPDALRAAIVSVQASTTPAHEIVISDDSTDRQTQTMVASYFADAVAVGRVVLVEGPRLGLGANRNRAIDAASGSHVLFIDDDVLISPGFIGEMAEMLASLGPAAAQAIVSGTEINNGEQVFPHRLSYLGYQSLDYRDDDVLETVVINATVFPRTLFERARFDENLVYGCDEMDMTVRAVHLHGFRIALAAASANHHFPSAVNRDFYAPFGEASRIYVTYKRYRWIEQRRLKAWRYLVTAYAHILLHDIRARGLAGPAAFFSTVDKSLSYIRVCAADRARHV